MKLLAKRIISIFLDILFTAILVFIIMLPINILVFFIKRYTGYGLPDVVYPILMMMIYFNKDIVKGKSIGKSILGLQIIDNSTGKTPSKFRCFIRNFTFFMFPIEILFIILSSSRRLGDILVGTRVIEVERNSIETYFSELFKEINIKKE